ncbi:uncharacterized protein BP5553_09434 [Venustampulla echinocandica]|uniref:Uncharacterized protein n=1 Tax=Venustampulla echinocandica TaxID=2656787 RepID=A0A370TCP6_9HELO|nr:uncharacterized protein BP5553_09434 [Venustampulla echinocandica]RDL32032.1 hypothetical protein BP5553_09434 [Venustampulla echinocandica]
MSCLPLQPTVEVPKESKKRKANDDEDLRGPSKQPAPASQDHGTQKRLSATRTAYQHFLDAYEGKTSSPLGSDTPRKTKNTIKGTSAYKCMLIFSTKDESVLLPACKEDGAGKYRYHISSQNPMLEIKLGVPQPQPFKSSHSLFISSEQICGKVTLSAIRNSTTGMFQQAVTDLGLPPISDNDEKIASVIDSIKNLRQENGIRFFRLAIIGPLSDPRTEPGYVGSQSPLVEKREGALSIQYITVARMSTDHLDFVDSFWDYVVHRFQKDGIYWGYKLDRHVPFINSANPQVTPSYSELVIMGHENAPYLPWMRDERTGSSVPHKM